MKGTFGHHCLSKYNICGVSIIVVGVAQSCELACREHMNVVFIGHVDAGKSTTGGQILYLTVPHTSSAPLQTLRLLSANARSQIAMSGRGSLFTQSYLAQDASNCQGENEVGILDNLADIGRLFCRAMWMRGRSRSMKSKPTCILMTELKTVILLQRSLSELHSYLTLGGTLKFQATIVTHLLSDTNPKRYSFQHTAAADAAADVLGDPNSQEQLWCLGNQLRSISLLLVHDAEGPQGWVVRVLYSQGSKREESGVVVHGVHHGHQ